MRSGPREVAGGLGLVHAVGWLVAWGALVAFAIEALQEDGEYEELAAYLGFVMFVFAAFGVVATVTMAVTAFRSLRSDLHLRWWSVASFVATGVTGAAFLFSLTAEDAATSSWPLPLAASSALNLVTALLAGTAHRRAAPPPAVPTA